MARRTNGLMARSSSKLGDIFAYKTQVSKSRTEKECLDERVNGDARRLANESVM